LYNEKKRKEKEKKEKKKHGKKGPEGSIHTHSFFFKEKKRKKLYSD